MKGKVFLPTQVIWQHLEMVLVVIVKGVKGCTTSIEWIHSMDAKKYSTVHSI